ncbi:MAG: type II toxin-antitoxin system VapC family toxin [Syntrophobacteraceae bacterium]
MKRFVLDCSISASWFLLDESNDAAQAVLERLREEEAVVPALWIVEMANVLVIAERKNRISPADAARTLEVIADLPIIVEPADLGTMKGCCTIAIKYSLSSYDACYLEIAQRLGLPLASLDLKLITAAGKSGIPLL